MLRYFAGLALVQLLTLGLFVLNADAEPSALALRVGLPALAVALLAALWFRTLSRVDGERDLARTRLEHERERERLRGEAAHERERITRAAERTVRREERRTGRRANLKVGLAFAATAGMGVLFVISELVTLGLLTMTTGGGALGGYLIRWRQTRGRARSGEGRFEEAPGESAFGRADDGLDRAVVGPLSTVAADDGDGGRGEAGEPLALPAPSRSPEEARGHGGRRRGAPGRAGVS